MVDKLNLMVQAQVTSAYQCSRLCEILSEVESGFECTLEPDQRGHHVTLAYKPTRQELAAVRKIFEGKEIYVSPTEIRWDNQIAAIFGYLVESPAKPKQMGGLYHITLGGTIPPVNSARLESKFAGSEKAFGAFPLEYTEVTMN